ncbi:MAG TPA: hypothetical protein VE615_07070 [Gaiellaceae bacterium]|nr:hypothetical protein [Gaiellaceae bacterium]
MILAAAAFGLSRLLTEPASPAAAAEPSHAAAKPCAGDAVFGHIKSLTSKGDHYELRFDPAWFLSGETANAAAAEDGAVEPGQPVPNDNYVVEEGHRLLTYLVPPAAHVTVLVKGAALDNGGFGSKAISVAQLAQLVKGEEPVELFEPLESGIWLRVHIDTPCSVEQQYRP